MRRLVSTFLILFLLLGQSLATAPHWHGNRLESETDEHAARPHVHLHGERHHHHKHDLPATEPAPVDHDSNAIYLADVDAVNDTVSTTASELAVSLLVFYRSPTTDSATVLDRQVRSEYGAINRLRPKCALYEQLLSIRC